MYLFFQSGLDFMSSLDTRNSTKNSHQGHNCLLVTTTQQEVVSWLVQLWLVDADCAFYDLALTTTPNEPISVLKPPNVPEESIATLRQFPPEASARLTDLTKARPLIIRTELNNVKTPDGGQLTSGFVDCAATLDVLSRDFVRRFALPTRKS
jgi:hypothetical protein